MAKRIKFSLKMTNGEQVRNLDGLRENFDLDSVLGYFADGKLLTWLEDRYYETEYEAVKVLTKDDPELGQKLCRIFNVVVTATQTVDIDVVNKRNKKLAILNQFTTDSTLFNKIDDIAVSQDEFEQLVSKKCPIIYLLNNEFVVSPELENVRLIGIGDVMLQTKDNEVISLKDKNVTGKNVKFDKKYLDIKILGEIQELEKQADEEYANESYKEAIELYQKAEALGSGHACARLGECYYYGKGVKKALKTAFEYFLKGSNLSDGEASIYVGDFYRLGKFVEKDGDESIKFYNKAIEDGYSRGYTCIGDLYLHGSGSIKKNLLFAVDYLNKGVVHGDSGLANYLLGTVYEAGGKELKKDIDKSISCYLEAGKQGVLKAFYNLGKLYETGNGVKKSMRTAVEYYKKSGARKGFGGYYWNDKPANQGHPVLSSLNIVNAGVGGFYKFGVRK